jgi:putative tricarboxylic transport membrane protein
MKRAWQITSLSFLALAIFSLVKSFEYPYMDKLGPGPGFFPFWLSIITGALAIALLFQTSLAKSAADETATLIPERPGLLRVLYILAALVVILALFNPLGFRITGGLL